MLNVQEISDNRQNTQKIFMAEVCRTIRTIPIHINTCLPFFITFNRPAEHEVETVNIHVQKQSNCAQRQEVKSQEKKLCSCLWLAQLECAVSDSGNLNYTGLSPISIICEITSGRNCFSIYIVTNMFVSKKHQFFQSPLLFMLCYCMSTIFKRFPLLLFIPLFHINY